MGNEYLKVIKESNIYLLIPQYTPDGYVHSYYTFGCWHYKTHRHFCQGVCELLFKFFKVDSDT